MVDVADDTASIGMQLLRDIHRIFTMAKKDRLPVAFLADRLTSMVDPQRDWNDLRGKPLDKFVLSKWLRPYGVQPKVMKIGGVSVRGYETTGAHGLSQAWARYTPGFGRNRRNRRNPAGQAGYTAGADYGCTRNHGSTRNPSDQGSYAGYAGYVGKRYRRTSKDQAEENAMSYTIHGPHNTDPWREYGTPDHYVGYGGGVVHAVRSGG